MIDFDVFPDKDAPEPRPALSLVPPEEQLVPTISGGESLDKLRDLAVRPIKPAPEPLDLKSADAHDPADAVTNDLNASKGFSSADALKADQLSKQSGTPYRVVLHNMGEAEEKSKKDQFFEAIAKSPALAAGLAADPYATDKVKDDIGPFSAIAEAIENISAAGVLRVGERIGRGLAGGVTRDIAGSTLSGFGEQLGDATHFVLDPWADALEAGVRSVLGDERVDAINRMFSGREDGRADGVWGPSDLLQFSAQGWKGLGDAVDPRGPDDPFYLEVARGVGQYGGQIGLAYLTGGVAAVQSLILYGQGVDQQLLQIEEDDPDLNQRMLAGVLGGALTYVTNVIQLETALKPLTEGVRSVAGRMLLSGGIGGFGEAAQEFVENIGQDAIQRLVTDPGKTIDWMDATYGAGVGGTVGAIVGVLLGGGVARSVNRNNRRIAEAENLAEQVNKAIEATRQVQMMESDPGGFAELIQRVADRSEGEDSTVFVDAEALQQTMAAMPEAEQARVRELMPRTFEEVQRASTTDEGATTRPLTGDNIEVPVSELLAASPQGNLAEFFIQQSRSDPHSMNLAEAQQAREEAGQLIRQEAERVVAQLDDAAALNDSADRVMAHVTRQLEQLGYAPEDNISGPYAQLVRSFYVATADRLGITPEQAYEQYPMRIKAPEGAPVGAGAQPAPVRVQMTAARRLERLHSALDPKSELAAAVGGIRQRLETGDITEAQALAEVADTIGGDATETLAAQDAAESASEPLAQRDAPNFGLPPAPVTLSTNDPLLQNTAEIPDDTPVTVKGVETTRGEFREGVVENHFEGITAPTGRAPIAYVMGGGGGSGKGYVSSILRQSGDIAEDNVVHIDPDNIKQAIPEYQEIVTAGDHRAAAVVHQESSMLADRALERGISGKYDLLLDKTLGNEGKGVAYIQRLKDAGYEVRLFGVTAPPLQALRNASARAHTTGRYVPTEALLTAHKGFNEAFPVYARMVDSARLYENDGVGEPVVVATKTPDGAMSFSPGYHVVEARSQINGQATTVGTLQPAQERGVGVTLGDQGLERAAAEELGPEQGREDRGVDGETALGGRPSVPVQVRGGPQATIDDFTPARLPFIMGKSGWSMLTAADPGATPLSDAENSARMNALREELAAAGIEFHEALGKYGDEQPTLLVLGVTEDQARDIGARWGQESVLTNRGLVFSDGSGRVTPATGEVTVFYGEPPSDFYTQLDTPDGPVYFSVGLDFEGTTTEGVFHQALATRVPQGESPVDSRGTPDLATLLEAPRAAAAVAKIMTQIPGLKRFARRKPAGALEGIVEQLRGNMVWLYNRLDPEVVEISRQWYDGANRIATRWVGRYGNRYDLSQMSAALASMSPQMDWYKNVTLVERILDVVTQQQDHVWDAAMDQAVQDNPGLKNQAEGVERVRGKRLAEIEDPYLQALWVSAYDRAHHSTDYRLIEPTGMLLDFATNKDGTRSRASWANGFAPVARALSILQDGTPENVSAQIGDGYKVRSFYNNIFAPNDTVGDVTMDTHAVAVALMQALGSSAPAVGHNFGKGPGSDVALGLKGSYPVYAEAYRRAAAELGMLPRELQSIMWNAVQSLLPPSARRGKLKGRITDIWDSFDKGEIDADTARQEFFDAAAPDGKVPAPDWLEARRDLAESGERWASTYTEELLEPERVERAAAPRTGRHLAGGGAFEQRVRPRVDAATRERNSVTLTGVHFSQEARTSLDGSKYGTGMRGLELERLHQAKDDRLFKRAFFYIDEGAGVVPESGVGMYAHETTLNNIYDAKADPLGIWRNGGNAGEQAVMDAGFDGYYVRGAMGAQGVAVLLGDAATDVAVEVKGTPDKPYGRRLGKYKLMLNTVSDVQAMTEALPTIREAAPSARIRAGTLEIDRSELLAAIMAGKDAGVTIPGTGKNVLSQTRSMAEDAPAQAEFLLDKAREAGFDNVDAWAEADPGGFTDAAEQWRATHPATMLEQQTRGNFDPASLTINLFKNADLSTFLHESGHFFLEVLSDMSTREGVDPDVTADMQSVLDWFGVKDIDTWRAMSLEEQRPHHEKFAEHFEHYLFEGQAPNAGLRRAFQRFRDFLIEAYGSLKNFMAGYGTEINPEIRGVFDRLLATRDEISEAEARAGMTPEQAATAAALDRLGSRSLRDLKWSRQARSRVLKRLQKDVEDKRSATREEVTEEVRQMPVYSVQRFLKFGELRDDAGNVEKVEGAKLSTQALREIFGDGPAALWRYLPPNILSSSPQHSLHPNAVAEMFGFGNGDKMVRAIVNASKEKDAIEGLTEQRLLERYGDIVTERGMENAADEAVHNEVRGRFVASELKALRESINTRTALAAAKEFARNMVGRKRIRDLRPSDHTAAERKAARASDSARAAGDAAAAVRAKRDQLLHHYAAKYTGDAKGDVERKLDYLNKFNRDSVRKNLPIEYLEQIDQLLEDVELRRGVTNKELDRRASYAEWISAQEARGFNPVIDEATRARLTRTSYKNMRYSEFLELVDGVRNVEKLGRLKSKLLTAKDAREFNETRDGVVDSIRANQRRVHKEPLDRPGKFQTAQHWVAGAAAFHRKLASYVRQLDGHKDGGAFWDALIRPMNERSDMEAGMNAAATVEVSRILEPFLRRAGMRKKQYIPLLGQSLSLETRLALTLNWGNEANRQRVMDGNGISEAQMEAIMGTLSAKQLQAVQEVWDYLETFWPLIKAKEERTTGVAPERVEPSPVIVRSADGQNVELRGGYYPIKYDTRQSSIDRSHELAEMVKMALQGAYTRATTRRGHTKQRAEQVGRPLRRDIRVLFDHITDVTHDLAWHEWLIDANRLLGDRKLDGAIREAVGPEALQAMKEAVQDIALGPAPARNAFERSINWVRTGASIAGLGFNLVSGMLQPFGISQSIVRIGPKYVAMGMAKWIDSAASMESVGKEIQAKSEFMRLRSKTLNREVREIQGRVSGKGKVRSAAENSYFVFIVQFQKLVDYPTWLGAYEKAQAQGFDEGKSIALADQAVRDTQSSGSIADLSRAERGGPLQRLFTNFYSFFNTTFNMTAEAFDRADFRKPRDVGALAVNLLALYTFPAVMAKLMKDAISGGLPDDDDEWGDYMAQLLVKEQLSYLMGTMIGVRDLSGALQGFSYSGPTGLRAYNEAANLIGKASKDIQEGELRWTTAKSALATGAVLLHIPTVQLTRFVDGYTAYVEGETDNPLAVITGPPRK